MDTQIKNKIMDKYKGLQLSKFKEWKLNRISKSNPVKDLLKSYERKADIGADVSSIYSALVALVGLAAAFFGLYYVQTRAKKFKDPTALGIQVIHASKVLLEKDLNIHYVCVPFGLFTLNFTLPVAQTVNTTVNPSLCTISTHLPLGTFFSISVPNPIGTSNNKEITIHVPEWKSLTCSTIAYKSFTVYPDESYLFMVCHELLNYTWKVIQVN